MGVILPVPDGVDEVVAAVDSTVYDVSSVETRFILEILLKLRINILNDRTETNDNTSSPMISEYNNKLE